MLATVGSLDGFWELWVLAIVGVGKYGYWQQWVLDLMEVGYTRS